MCEDCESHAQRVLRHGGDLVHRRYERGRGFVEVVKVDTYASGGKLIRTKVPNSQAYGGPVTILYDDAGHVASVIRGDAS